LCLVVVPSGACLVASPPDAPGIAEGLVRGRCEQPACFGHGQAGQAGVAGWFLAGRTGSLPVSRQCSGWSVMPVLVPAWGAVAVPGWGGAQGTGVPGGRAVATASSARAHMDSTVWRWNDGQRRSWCWSSPACPFPAGSTPRRLCRHVILFHCLKLCDHIGCLRPSCRCHLFKPSLESCHTCQ
jgi:hypothetical protein